MAPGFAIFNQRIWEGRRPPHMGCRRPSAILWRQLPQFHLGAGVLQLLFDIAGFGLVDAVLDGLGSAFDQVLRLLEAKSGDRPHFLDYIDLLLAGLEEND